MRQVSLILSFPQISGSVAVIALEGIVTADAEAAMMEALEYAASKAARSIVLDFSLVSGMDSGGASILVKFWVSSRSRHMSLMAAGLRSELRDVFRLTGLERVMSTHDTRSAALSAKGISQRLLALAAPGNSRLLRSLRLR